MSTRAEQYRSNEQRKSKRTAKQRPEPKKQGQATKSRVAPSRAAYALEPTAANGRRSRKSTRGSANRVKPDTAFNLRESLVKGSPEARARKARAKDVRARGSAR